MNTRSVPSRPELTWWVSKMLVHVFESPQPHLRCYGIPVNYDQGMQGIHPVHQCYQETLAALPCQTTYLSSAARNSVLKGPEKSFPSAHMKRILRNSEVLICRLVLISSKDTYSLQSTELLETFFKDLVIILHVCMCVPHTCKCQWRPEEGCELLDVDAGNWTQVLCRRTKCS